MLFLRFFWFLLWPIRLPFFLLARMGRLLRPARVAATLEANRAGEAIVAGAAAGVAPDDEYDEVRQSGLFHVLKVEESDEPRIDDSGIDANKQLTIAEKMAKNAREYYAKRPPLFPSPHREDSGQKTAQSGLAADGLSKDFYEEVELGFLEEVTRIDNGGAEDQFMRMLTKGRRIANANARVLYCELAPLVLFLALVGHMTILLFDPFRVLHVGLEVSTIAAYFREGATGIALGAVALGVAVLFTALIYQFSYTHIQRQNAFDLNAFIQTEFSRLNGSFKAAFRECLQAETRLDNSQHDKVGPIASAWALAYHWIGVRQLMEELAIRNMMFQIRRNTALYMILGAVICFGVAALVGLASWATTLFVPTSTHPIVALGHIAAMVVVFVLVSYGISMRRPFSIIATRFRKEQWDRFDTLAIGEVIGEQVSRDKLQIVIQRDTRR